MSVTAGVVCMGYGSIGLMNMVRRYAFIKRNVTEQTSGFTSPELHIEKHTNVHGFDVVKSAQTVEFPAYFGFGFAFFPIGGEIKNISSVVFSKIKADNMIYTNYRMLQHNNYDTFINNYIHNLSFNHMTVLSELETKVKSIAPNETVNTFFNGELDANSKVSEWRNSASQPVYFMNYKNMSAFSKKNRLASYSDNLNKLYVEFATTGRLPFTYVSLISGIGFYCFS